jgi:DNA-binding MarR family transcriptional regulator
MQGISESFKKEKYSQVMAVCACINTRKASRAVTHFYDEMLKPSGLLSTQFALITAIYTNSDVTTTTTLAKELDLDRTTLTRNLEILKKNGSIAIGSGDDKRKHPIALTAKGIEAMEKAVPLWQKAQSKMVQNFGERRWKEILKALSILVESSNSKLPQ